METGNDSRLVDHLPPDVRSHSFVVRLWIEEPGGKRGQATWRGHITNVATREKRYVKDLDDIVLVIMPCLQRVGARFNYCWRARQWLNR